VLPARAGLFPRPCRRGHAGTGAPRASGAVPPLPRGSALTAPCSPRERGCSLAVVVAADEGGVLPAQAWLFSNYYEFMLPLMGMNPRCGPVKVNRLLCSPHPWGFVDHVRRHVLAVAAAKLRNVAWHCPGYGVTLGSPATAEVRPFGGTELLNQVQERGAGRSRSSFLPASSAATPLVMLSSGLLRTESARRRATRRGTPGGVLGLTKGCGRVRTRNPLQRTREPGHLLPL
jgi:hypothetical protein